MLKVDNNTGPKDGYQKSYEKFPQKVNINNITMPATVNNNICRICFNRKRLQSQKCQTGSQLKFQILTYLSLVTCTVHACRNMTEAKRRKTTFFACK